MNKLLNTFHEDIVKSDENNDIAIRDCVAHMICEVDTIISSQECDNNFSTQFIVPDHAIVFAHIKIGFVRERYLFIYI